MYAIMPIASSSALIAVEAHVTPSSPSQATKIEYVFTDLVNKQNTLSIPFSWKPLLSQDEKLILDQECNKMKLGIPRIELSQSANKIAAILQRYCVTTPSDLFANRPDPIREISLIQSTLHQQKEEFLKLISESHNTTAKDPELAPLLPSIESDLNVPPVVEIFEPTTKSKNNSRSHSKEQLDENGSQHVSTQVNPSQHVSSLQEQASVNTSKACGKRSEALLAEQLYKETQCMNAKATRSAYIPLPFAVFASVTNIIGLLLTTNIPRCTDSSELSHKKLIYGFNWATAVFACFAAATSFFSRSAILPSQMTVSYQFNNPSILELPKDEVDGISRNIQKKGEWYPDCLLTSESRQIRKNMLALAKYAKVDRVIGEKIAKANNKEQTRPLASIEDNHLARSRVVSKLNLLGMLTMLASTAWQIALQFTESPAVLGCPSNTTSIATPSPHDPRNDLTNDSIAPFIATMIGCACLAVDGFRKWSHNKHFLAFQKPPDIHLNSEV